MKHIIYTVLLGIYTIIVLLPGPAVWAQNAGDASGTEIQQSDLPPGAIYRPGEVLHVVRPNENLHLLAGFYYGDTRQWSRIYQKNRSVIPNRRVLKVGQKLRVPVPEGWQPFFPYHEWFRLATRNGEWTPGGGKRAIPQPTDSPASIGPTFSPAKTPSSPQQPPHKVPAQPPVTTPIEQKPAQPVKPVEVEELPQEVVPVEEPEIQMTEDTANPKDDTTVAPAF